MDRYLGKGPQLHAGGEIDHRDGRDTHRYGASPIGYAARESGESGQCEALVAEGRAATGAKVRRIEYRARQIDVRKGGQQSLPAVERSEEHTSELPSLMRISYAVLCLKK